MPGKDWQTLFEQEIQAAEAARAEGNEGKARVCARRAAGLLCSQFLSRNGIKTRGISALDFLQQMQDLETLDEQIRTVIALFLQRVDENKKLPGEVDLLAQARWLRRYLYIE